MTSTFLALNTILIVELQLNVILPSQWSKIQQSIRHKQRVKSSCKRRVSMKDLVPLSEKHTHPWTLSLHKSPHHWIPVIQYFLLVLVIILDRSNSLIIGDMEVVVEIRAERRIPREVPTHSLFEFLDLSNWSTRNEYQACLSGMQVAKCGREVVCLKGTSVAADFVLGCEHEVLDDELLAAVKEVCECDFAFGTIEGVLLVDLYHG